MKRPYVICHMGSTVNGKIIGENWGEDQAKYGKLYERCHGTYHSQAWMVGRVTMEKDFTEGLRPRLPRSAGPIARKAFIGDKEATSFAIAVDAKGKLGWSVNEIDGDHVIEILSESVSDAYLLYLQNMKVSYIFAGRDDLDFKVAFAQLHGLFGIKKLMLEGGGHINGSILNAGLIDELSLLIVPIVDGTSDSPTTFETADDLPENVAGKLRLVDVQKLEHGVVWLKYRVGATHR